MGRTSACAFLLVMLLFTACKKIDNHNKRSNSIHNTTYEIPSELEPSVSGGMLCFEDIDQFEDYCRYLDSIAADTTNPTDTLGGGIRLDDIESQFNYTSLRSVVQAEFEILNEIGWDDVEDVPVEKIKYLGSMGSVYNSDRNVKVGDKINHIYNEDFGILIIDGSTTTLDKVNDLPAGLSEEQLYSMFALDDNVNVYNLNLLCTELGRGSAEKVTQDTTWRTNFSIKRDMSSGWQCSNSDKKYTLIGIGLTAQGIDPFDIFINAGNKNELDIWVDWGDGNTQTFNNVLIYIQYNYTLSAMEIIWPTLPQTHTYANGGTKTVKIKVKRPYHSTWVAEAQHSVEVPEYTCNTWVKKRKLGVAVSGDNKRTVQGLVETHQNFWSRPVFEATSWAYEYKNNKWRDKKAERLVAQIWFDTYVDCAGNPTFRSAAEWPYNDKKTTAHTGGWVIQNATYSIIYSNHRVLYNGSYINLDMQLPRCD